MSPDEWLTWVNRVYFGAGVVLAFATIVTLIAGFAQSRLSGAIAARKDQEFAEFKISADRQIAELHKATAEANQRAEEDRLARVAIEQRLAPRTLSPTGAAELVGAVSGHPGTKLDVWVASESEETAALAVALVHLFQQAGFAVQVWTWTGVTGMTGVLIFTPASTPTETTKLADLITISLNQVGLAAARQQWPAPWDKFGGMLNGPPFQGIDAASIRVVVGSKP